MSGQIRVNHGPDGYDHCPFCDDSGWVYLLRPGSIAACGWCSLGHSHHQRFGGPWNYRAEDVELELHDVPEVALRPHERAAWHRSQEKLADQLQLEQNVEPPTQMW